MGRRGNGEGTITRRSDGRFAAALRLEDGKRKWYYGKTKREVQQRLREAQVARTQGQDLAAPSQTMSAFLHRWLEDKVRQSVKGTTYDSYALNVRRVEPYLGRVRIDALKAAHIQHCYARLQEDGLGAVSVAQVHRVLRAAMRQAVRWGLLAFNPVQGAAPPKAVHRDMKTLTPEQVRILLVGTQADHHHALWALLVTTGLRVGEALALTWADIDLDGATLVVRRTVHPQRGKGLVFTAPKTNRSRRTVHLPVGTVAAPRYHQDRQKLAYRADSAEWTDQALVFQSATGGPIDGSNIYDALQRTLARLGLPAVRTHDLRHTCATYLLTTGTHPKVVQDLLGHSSITLTLDTYSHVIPALHAQAAISINQLFDPQDKVEFEDCPTS